MAFMRNVTLVDIVDRKTGESKNTDCHKMMCDVDYNIGDTMRIRLRDRVIYTTFVAERKTNDDGLIEIQTINSIYKFQVRRRNYGW